MSMQACRLLDHAAFGKLELNSPIQRLHRRCDSWSRSLYCTVQNETTQSGERSLFEGRKIIGPAPANLTEP